MPNPPNGTPTACRLCNLATCPGGIRPMAYIWVGRDLYRHQRGRRCCLITTGASEARCQVRFEDGELASDVPRAALRRIDTPEREEFAARMAAEAQERLLAAARLVDEAPTGIFGPALRRWAKRALAGVDHA